MSDLVLNNIIYNAQNQLTNLAINEISAVIAPVTNKIDNEINQVVAPVLDKLEYVDGLITQALSFSINFTDLFTIAETDPQRLVRYFSYPNAFTAYNPLNILNASYAPLPSPADSRLGQSQFHRLATAQQLNYTLVARKDGDREMGIMTTSGKTWNEPMSPYAAAYPYNRVYATRGGIVQEFDDTPHNVRYNLHHPAGTYDEIDNNGTRVQKVVGESYEIYAQHRNVYIKGVCNLTVEGSCNIKVMNNANISAAGKASIDASSIEMTSKSSIVMNAKDIIYKANNITMEAEKLNIGVSDIVTRCKNLAIDSKTTNINSDKVTVNSKSTGFIGDTLYLNSNSIQALPVNGKRVADTRGDYTLENVLVINGNSLISGTDIPEIQETGITLVSGDVAYPQDPEFPLNPRPDRAFINAVKFDDEGSSFTISQNGIMPLPNSSSNQPISLPNINREFSRIVDVSDVVDQTNIPGNKVLSKHCTLAMLTTDAAVTHYQLKAQMGLTEGEIAANLKRLAVNVVDKIYDRYGKGNVIITSGFRLPSFSNTKSQHPLGQAVDIQFRDLRAGDYAARAAEIAAWLDYDQLLFEYSSNGENYNPWIHISFNAENNRHTYATINTSNNQFMAGVINNPFATA